MLEQLSTTIIHLIQSAGYPAVFFLMLLESALIPIPSEITMPFAGFLAQQGHVNFILIVFLGALGNLIGSLIAYAIGYYLEDALILRLINKYGKYILLREHEYTRALKWFDNYGSSVTFFSRLLPAVRTFISLPPGLAKMNIIKFSLYTFLGSLISSEFLAYLGYYLGSNWQSIHGYFNKLHYVIGAVVVLAVLFYIYKHLKKRKYLSFCK